MVVGNPPYINVDDSALNQLYRQRYQSCYRQYSLGVPFTERFFQLSLSVANQPPGYVGLITTNSFMKREFGKKLIEAYLPRQDLTHVIDTSGADIPGHGTPTVILFARHRQPVGETVRAVLGIRGETGTPNDPARGLVWRAITKQVDLAGSESVYVSVADMPRAAFAKHPWSIAGGGTTELKTAVENVSTTTLGDTCDEIGRTTVVGEDDVWIAEPSFFQRKNLVPHIPLIVGDRVRDWSISHQTIVLLSVRVIGR